MSRTILLVLFFVACISSQAQDRVFTKSGRISFYSKAPLEDIEAHNKNGVSVIDKQSGRLEFSILMKAFEFEKALMQEHFNENYVESDKFPKAVFKGIISDQNAVNFRADGTYTAMVNGKLTLHGITRDVAIPGRIRVNNGKISATAEFPIVLTDYNISIPALMKEKISNTVKVVIEASYENMN